MYFVGMETPSSSELHLVRGNLVCVWGGGADHVTRLAGGGGGGHGGVVVWCLI